MVYHGCMVDFGGSLCHGYICILLYVKLMKLIGCTGVAEISGRSICHGYICILLYMKLIGCTGVAEISGHLELEGLPAMGISGFFYMGNLLDVAEISGHLETGGSLCHGYICILLYGKLIGCSRDLWSFGNWGVSLPWVHLHSSIWETYWM